MAAFGPEEKGKTKGTLMLVSYKLSSRCKIGSPTVVIKTTLP